MITEVTIAILGGTAGFMTAVAMLLREVRATCAELRRVTSGGIPVRIVSSREGEGGIIEEFH